MLFIDFIILLLFIWAVYQGWRRGFLKEVVSIVGFIIGLLVATALYSSFGEYLTPKLGASPTVANVIAFVLLWIIVPIVLGMVANILTKAIKGMKAGLPNSILGTAVSVLKYLVLMSCVFNVMSFLHIVSPQKAADSFFYEPVKNSLGYFFMAVNGNKEDNAAPNDSVNVVDSGDIVYITRDSVK